MSKEECLIDSRVSQSQCRKAVEALHSHELKKKQKFEENQILPAKEQHVWLNVTVKQVAPTHKIKPHKIPIIHPLVDPRTTSICLITKDPQRQYKDLLESNNIKFISRVVGIEKLKGKFKPFEARRMLLKENGMFLADQRVIPLLPKLLGSKWFEAKKQPIPVCLTRKDLKGELERAISSTYMNQNRGTCSSIKVGKLSQQPSQILDNLKTAIPAVAKVIPGGWDNVQSLHIKTNSSVSLPIWSCSLEDTEAGRWGLPNETSAIREGEKEEDREDTPKNPRKSKSRKRSSTGDDEAEEETTRKKPKPTLSTVSPPRAAASQKKDQKTTGPPKTLLTSKSPAPAEVGDKSSKMKEASSLKATTTKDQTKSKYSSASLEKKKRLIAKAKGGKSIKNLFLGKKVAQG